MSTSSQSPSHLRFRPDIEGLRAIAILFVVLYHAGWKRVSGGFLGVDVFFVLSGFLITGLLLQELRNTGRVSLTNFWARRARRLLPAAAFLMVAVLIGNALLLTPFDQITYANTARAFAVYGSNILFAVRNTDYFSNSALRDPLLHTWSLSVEEQFYLFFAPLVVLLGIIWKKSDTGRFNQRFAILMAIASALSFGLCLWFARHYPTIGFYLLPTRVWEFGIGALVVLLVEGTAIKSTVAIEGMSLVGLVLLLLSAVLVNDAQPLGWTNFVPVAGTALLIYAGSTSNTALVGRLLASAPLRLLGRLSYSWYLWHWPVLVYLRERVDNPSLTLRIAAAFLSLIPAAITYQLVESPIRFSTTLQRVPKRVVWGAIALAVITLAGAGGASLYARNVLASPRYAAVVDAEKLPEVHNNGCLIELLDVTVHECRSGSGTNDTVVVLFGDSHAAQWFPAMNSIAASRGWTLHVFTKTACPVAMVPVVNGKLARHYTECETWRQNAFQRITSLHPTLVVAANVRVYNIIVNGKTIRSDGSAEATRAWGEGMSTALNALRASNAAVVVLQDTPRMPFDAPSCVIRHMDSPNDCRAKTGAAIDSMISGAERSAVSQVAGAEYLSLNQLMCDDQWCPAVANGMVRYRDTNHLSVGFATTLAPALSQHLSETLARKQKTPVAR
ncbi:MAG: acyltransferase family protein [Gemmatimonadaceae bacterium]